MKLFGPMVAAVYDPLVSDGPYPHEAVQACDFAVLAVGTPPGRDGAADLSCLWEALGRIPPEQPVLIRSTIPPGTMGGLEKTRPLAAHMPEFLNERPGGMWRESGQVPFTILGGSPAAHEFFLRILDRITGEQMRPVYCCTGLEAELVKYTANCYLAAKVTFVNEMARVCEAFGADWDSVRHGWLLDPRAGASHTKVEGPGFGGRCLPKDLAAVIKASERAGYMPEFLWALEEANARFQDREARA